MIGDVGSLNQRLLLNAEHVIRVDLHRVNNVEDARSQADKLAALDVLQKLKQLGVLDDLADGLSEGITETFGKSDGLIHNALRHLWAGEVTSRGQRHG